MKKSPIFDKNSVLFILFLYLVSLKKDISSLSNDFMEKVLDKIESRKIQIFKISWHILFFFCPNSLTFRNLKKKIEKHQKLQKFLLFELFW